MIRVLITGAAGFIATHLVMQLKQAGIHDLRLLDSRTPAYLSQISGCFYQSDLVQIGDVPGILDGVDTVFHLAWGSIPETSVNSPVDDVASSIIPTIRLLEQCVRNHVKRIVFLSTGGAIYGMSSHLPVSEDHPTNPISAYGVSKLAAEKYLELFHHLYGLEYTILRPAVAYGEYQNLFGRQGAVAVFIGNILNRQPISIWGDPKLIVRDFLYAGDLARACILAAHSNQATGVYNLGTGIGISLAELIDLLSQVVGSTHPIDVQLLPPRAFDVPDLVLDISKSKKLLNWSPETDMKTGVEKTWKWAQSIVSDSGKS